jgi:hypothetical protein
MASIPSNENLTPCGGGGLPCHCSGVILLGKDAKGFTTELGVKCEEEQLKDQIRLLPESAPRVAQSILDSIAQVIAELEKKGRLGRYAVAALLDLWFGPGVFRGFHMSHRD